jgi:hypothetical protein
VLGPDLGAYSWRCTLCDANGYGGAPAYEAHYGYMHTTTRTPTYIDFVREARNEHGLKGTAAYEWAHSAWNEYQKNQ